MDSWSSILSNRCEKLQAPSYLNLAISIFILLGILVSYLPQHYRIISRGTSEGISPFFILLGTTSGTCAFTNILVLPASRADVACCKTVSTFECAAGLLGIAQVGVQWFCFSIILLLFLVFFPRTPVLPTLDNNKQHTWRTAITVAFICLLHGLVTVMISAALAYSHPDRLGTWANTLGIMATVLAAIQYIPQIWMTYNLGHVGSLSIPMMLIQTPGSFVWSASLAARLGAEGWSTWGVFLVTGCLQGCLLVMGICFEIKARRERKNGGSTPVSCTTHLTSTIQKRYANNMQTNGREHDTDDEGGTTVENTPLLSGSQPPKKPSRAPKKPQTPTTS
ncbi:PQ loop repeat protein [Rutstroemia sp. NJR-2017a BVV2]|nr:PQ loop repeat protein [Rutstroemia sp. NJR-2017a BVV2]